MREQGEQEPLMAERFSMVEVTDSKGNVLPPKSLGITEVTIMPVAELPSPIDEAARLGIDIEDYLQG